MNFKMFINRAGLVLKKYSPELFTGLSIASGVAATVVGCVRTQKLEVVKNDNRNHKEVLHAEKPKMEEKEYRKELTRVYVHNAKNYVVLYWPAATLSVVSIASALAAYGILKKRTAVLAAGLTALTQEFQSYRDKVKEKYGDSADNDIMKEISGTKVITTAEDGTIAETIEAPSTSVYSKFFDEYNENWSRSADDNLTFLKCQENTANQLLHARGHLFLNEAYDLLGIKRTNYGSVCGWVVGNGDDYVDFGIFDRQSDAARAFVNGNNNAILLNFNVDGVIYNLI